MKHARILAPALLFVLLAAAGTVWLVHVARGGPAPSPQLVDAGDAPVGSGEPSPSTATAAPATTVTSASAGASASAAGATAGSASGAGARSDSGSVSGPAPGGTGTARAGTPATRPAPPGAPPVPVRAIRVGGVTLDDTSPRTMCYIVRNVDSPVTVRITALAAGNPAVVIDPERCAVVATQPPEGWTLTFPCSPGADLKPHGDGCWTGIEPRRAPSGAEENLHSSFSVTLRARCTSTAGRPCQDSGSPAPTAARPVDVTWTQPYGDGELCIRNPPDENPFCV